MTAWIVCSLIGLWRRHFHYLTPLFGQRYLYYFDLRNKILTKKSSNWNQSKNLLYFSTNTHFIKYTGIEQLKINKILCMLHIIIFFCKHGGQLLTFCGKHYISFIQIFLKFFYSCKYNIGFFMVFIHFRKFTSFFMCQNS